MTNTKTPEEITEERKQKIREMELPSELEKITDIDPEKYRSFLLHDCNHRPCPRQDIIEGYTYHFTETSVGTALEISCPCGYKEDITDYDCW